jgi:hypothetical protein
MDGQIVLFVGKPTCEGWAKDVYIVPLDAVPQMNKRFLSRARW